MGNYASCQEGDLISTNAWQLTQFGKIRHKLFSKKMKKTSINRQLYGKTVLGGRFNLLKNMIV